MADKSEKAKKPCSCPYCDEEIARASLPWCEACGVEILHCPECHQAVPRDVKSCPHCGADVAHEMRKERR